MLLHVFFGCCIQEFVLVYFKRLLEMTSIMSTIEKIRKENRYRVENVKKASILHNHQSELDTIDRPVYISVEVHPDCLDNGSDVTEASRTIVWRQGVVRGDMPVQIIGKQLGGSGHICNVIPFNEKIDITAWKNNEAKIYEHVKKGGDRHARMFFSFEYDEESEKIARPIRIYYHFELYENNNIVGSPMEEVIESPEPRTSN